ncbi:MAG TPA: MFS transporter [Gaiellaceae bacterium]|nr:MFS transporter [Gaiellaceae bacterium]
MTKVREQLRESLRAMREVFANRGLRRLQLAWAGSIIGTWAFAIALSVYAYDHGGPAAVGLVVLIRWLPAAFAAPFMGILGDRYPRVLVMIGSDLVRAAAFAGMTAIVLAHGPPAAVYALVGLTSIISTAFRPAQAALLPALARTPEELTAANLSSSTLESLGFCVGPALGGLLLTVSNTWVVFALTGATFLWSALLLAGLLKTDEPPLVRESRPIVHEAVEGFRAIAHDGHLQLVIGLFSAQTLVNGAMGVMITVSALQLLDIGPGGVGYLNAAVGVGGLIGAFFSLMLVGRRRLAGMFGLAVAGTGGPMIFIAPNPSTAIALVAFALIGVSNIVEDVAGFTILQRTAPAEVLSRVFGVVHSLFCATVALGAILAPRLIDLIGVRWSLVTIGAILPVLALVTRVPLVRLDDAAVDRGRQVGLLQAIPIFSPLSPAILEGLAARLEPVRVMAGDVIVRQGDLGDRFYVIAAGEVEVGIDGQMQATQGPGDHFGEIALVRDVPRTATVTARTDVDLYALEREDFLAAVTGHSASAEAAEAVVGARLGVSTI